MTANRRVWILWLLFLLALNSISLAAPTPIPDAHSHNDYEHSRPLLDALDAGFCSVEADIYLVDGQLLVAHDRDQVRPERTLQRLYLDPLRERVDKNGGRVYPGGPDLILLVDIKSDGQRVYPVLREVLKQYATMLTEFRSEATRTRAVTVILSGDRPKTLLANEDLRYAALDGRLEDLEGQSSPHLIPLVSDDWKRIFKWNGTGTFPEHERKQLGEIVAKAHQQGRKVRFWGQPDRSEVWQVQRAAGVDLINTDRLSELAAFLKR
jgi:hypothetical protein